MRDKERFLKQVEFITEIDRLKQVLRNTILLDASRKENDVEHSWHLALAAMILAEYSNFENLDLHKVMKMVLIHDIVEIDAGDVFVHSTIDREEVKEKERKAAERIFGLLPLDQAEELRRLWDEFEEGVTAEAKFARALDRFMPILHNYKTKGLQWQKLGVTAAMVLERNKAIEEGSEILWDYVQNMVREAVEKGFLKER